jgi:Rrf2 family transcriptional regulator, cysteine metabolism repressor
MRVEARQPLMALLNRKVDYALLVLSYLHHNPEGGCARALADRFGLSRAFVANILKRLCKHGCVASQRGIKGGYVLVPATMRLSLADLMAVLEDSFQLAECNVAVPRDCCPHFDDCPVKGPIAEVDRRLREVLTSVKVADLFGVKPDQQSCHALQLVQA